jgi:amino acid transporter
MRCTGDTEMIFESYLKMLLKIITSSSLTIALLTCILILLVGNTSMNFEIGLEIERIDGFWVLLGLPVVATLAFIMISPISFLVYRLLWRQELPSTSEGT